MPFSSYIGRRGGGGGGAGTTWAQSLLPSSSSSSSSPKPKVPQRRSRRRTALINFLFTNFFTIALSISLIFLLITIFHFGIPKPFSSPFKSRPKPTFRLFKPRKTIHRNPQKDNDNKDAISGAVVDITTKGLYDKIEFLDVDGGPWKQGWRVNYKGNEWDTEKLKVFVVPHSHNDPGWKLTVDEYYARQSRHILDTIVATLSKVNDSLSRCFFFFFLLI